MSSDALTEAVSEAVIVGKPSDLEPNLWFDGDGNKSMTSFEALQNTRHSSFVTSFPVGTDVGVTQALVLRLNSSLFCDTVAQQAFPTSCLGNASFNASYTNADDSAIKLAK